MHAFPESVNLFPVITSFGDQATSDLFHGHASSRSRRIPADIHEVALRKLDMLNAAESLDDLRHPPGNRLEALRGALQGFYSIRINSQWRVVFRWQPPNARDVQILDYH